MRAEIITIGDELLYGQIEDSNSPFVAEKLTSSGLKVVFKTSVGDDITRIAEAFETARSRVDVIIATGGLGPTSDDLTKKAIVKTFKRNLVLHPEILKNIEDSFQKRGIPMPSINQNQALIPQGTKALSNLWGIAPGIFLEDENTLFFALPGVPVEMQWMLENEVMPMLRAKRVSGSTGAESFILHRKLKTTGISESALFEKIEKLIDPKEEIKIAFLPTLLGVTIRLTMESEEKDPAETKLDEYERKVREILGSLIYGVDEQTLEEVVGRLLFERKKTIAVAESCTGGLLGSRITNISGSSRYFERGVVTYSNQSKTELLKIPPEDIEKYGAVSKEIALLMAEGVRKLARSDFGLSVTGIAGPTGGTPQKPVGLVYIGFAYERDSFAERFIFGQDRRSIRERAAQAALNVVRLFMLNGQRI